MTSVPQKPATWRRVHVADVCETVSVGIVIQPSQYYVEPGQGIRAFRSANVGESRIVDRDWVYLSPEGHRANSKSSLRAGDVLVVRSGAPGTACVVTEEYAGSNCIDIVFARPQKDQVLPEYLAEFTNSPVGRRHVLGTQGGLALKHFNVGAYKQLELLIPDVNEQKKIVSLFKAWGAAIQRSEQLIAAKGRQLAHFRDVLLRDPERASLAKLRDVTKELTMRNGASHGREAVMAVTNQSGMRPMRAETIAAGIERYKRVPRRAFAYNPMRLNIGSIAMSPFDHEVLVSPDYVVFSCDESKLIPAYLNHLRYSRKWKSHFEQAGNGSVRVRIYYDDIARFRFRLPSIDLQKRLVRLLDSASLEIALLNQQANALRAQKRGLMQKLLTGQWRLPSNSTENK